MAQHQHELVPTDPAALPAQPVNLGDVLAPGETITPFDLPRLRVPAGGSLVWELPTGDTAKTIEAVIVHRQLTRAYWPETFDGGSAPPSCSSVDAIHGIGDPGGDCRTCPHSQWGSDGGRGQACHLITRLFLLPDGADFPWLLQVPPSGANRCRQFVIGAALHYKAPYWALRVAIGLERAQSAGGIAYSTPTYRVVGVVAQEELARIEGLRAALVPALEGIAVERAS